MATTPVKGIIITFLAGMHGVSLLVHDGSFLDGMEVVCADLLVCCVSKWFVVSHVFWYGGEGSCEVRIEFHNNRNVFTKADQNGVTCRFTRYFSKNGNKYYFQIIWTHYCTI